MARRIKKDEIIEEVKVIEPVEIEQPEIKATVKKVTKKKNNVKIKSPRVNIRKTPSLLGEVLIVASAGDKFELINDGEDGFYEIKCEGMNAFVMKDYAELV